MTRVLVVDDSLTVRMDLVEGLTQSGFDAVGCATAAEARAAFSAESFPLILLDVILPDGDGIDLLAEIRGSARSADAMVMMLSTEGEVRDRIRGLSKGADEYVGKPYEIAYVIARARQLLRRRIGDDADGTRILVIDDSATFREGLRELLVGAGYRVSIAATGEEGLAVAADMRPHAIVVDGQLPGIDGTTVIRRVRLDTALRRTPCLLLTGSNDPASELRALDAGADAFVRKEDDPSVVLARVAAILRSAAASGDALPTSALGPKKVLAVDDEKSHSSALASVLRGQGYEVVVACSGEEALELLAVEAVDCILLDQDMPGMGGLEVCRRIKAAPRIRDTPLVMLTAGDSREEMLKGLAAGADDSLMKSRDSQVLEARIVALIRRKQFEDENRSIREQHLRAELEAAEARAARELAETRAHLLDELRCKNEELEAFSYSVSHDLRAPLRSITGFSRALLEEYGDRLDDDGRGYLQRVSDAANRMDRLVHDMLDLARVSRAELTRKPIDLSQLAADVLTRLRDMDPTRAVEIVVDPGMRIDADPALLGIVLENLLGNAWKFTSKRAGARIEVGVRDGVVFVADNGAGFDPAYSKKLFHAFQRLHSTSEFEGTGVGLATVHRVIERHGGRIWAEGRPNAGATFHFTLHKERRPRQHP